MELSKGTTILRSFWALITSPVCFVWDVSTLFVFASHNIEFGFLSQLRLDEESLLCQTCGEVRTRPDEGLLRYSDVILFAELLNVCFLPKLAFESLVVNMSVYGLVTCFNPVLSYFRPHRQH